MRKIAFIAVAFAALIGLTAGTLANTHMAAADVAEYSNSTTANTEPQTTEQAAPVPEATPVVVSVVSGDTLSGIAADHQTTYMRLYDANEFINNPDLIYVGDQIRIPNADEQIAERTATAVAETTAPVESAPVAEATTYSEPVAEAPVASAPVVEETAPAAVSEPVVEQPAATQTVSASDQAAKDYIYFHESSNNPNATNYLGCYGLGQDCNGIVRDLCGADWACQDEFFTNYAYERYGSWQNALAFWQANHWW